MMPIPLSLKIASVLESAAIDKEAHKAATSPKNDLPEPTEGQKKSGTYKKGHVTISGLEISIENPAGSERSGVDRDGKKWTSKLNHHYGYIKGTKGRDKDQIDVFLGPDPEDEDKVSIVNQVNPETGAFDEHKVMLGFPSEEDAKSAYLSNYEEGWQGLGSICTLTVDEFKDWLKNGDTTIPVVRGAGGAYRQDYSWIGVDLDGTLARYDGWGGDGHVGEPVPLMMDYVKNLIKNGKTVKIFTARAADRAKIPPVKEWLKKHGLGNLEVTNIKDQNMIMLYDDRAAKVITNTGIIVERARGSSIMERGSALDWRVGIQKARSFSDIEDVFAATFGTLVIRKFVDGEIDDLEKKIQELRKKAAKYLATGAAGKVLGSKTTAYLNDNSPIDLQYAVMEADSLITSHSDEMSVNQEFSQTLQPRDRTREGMKLQVDIMANKLNPERLGESTSVSTGAPIIGQDKVVESGNGRTIAIRKAYAAGAKGQEYKQWLIDNAEDFGIPAKEIEGMQRPVLVRIRLTEIDRAEFARRANEDEIAQMAPAELARADAAKLTDDDIALFSPSEDGNIASASNRPFIGRFFERLGQNAATGYMTKDGKYTKQLIDRVQAAIFQKAYQDDNLLSLMAEESDPKIKNILSAMTIAAGEFSKAKAIDSTLMGIDIPKHVIEAAKIIKKAREDGQAVQEALAQTALFEEIPEDTKMIALFIDKNIRSARRMGDVLKESAKILRQVLVAEKEPKLLDTGDPLPTAAQIVDMAITKEKETRETGLFESAPRNKDNFLENEDGLVKFPAGTIARDNQSDATFTLNKETLAARDNSSAYRIRGLMQGAKSYDSHWIYRRDNEALFKDMAKSNVPRYNWKAAIQAAATYGDIEAVFRELFPLTPGPTASRKALWEMTRKEFMAAENAPKVDAIKNAIKQGKRIVLTTQYKAIDLNSPEVIKLDSSGTVRLSQGKQWVALVDDQVNSLAKQAGLKVPSFEDRVYHIAEIERALAEGKSVPAEVLKDYPYILDKIKEDLLAYIHDFPDFIFESELAGKTREQIRKFLEGIKPESIKALKLGSHEAYLEVLKALVAKLFPEGAEYTFRKTGDGSETDYEHFLKDRVRENYIQTIGDTIKRSDIRFELKEDGKDKEYFIKKYFDQDIQKDVWDIVIAHDKEVRTKFARIGKDAKRYIEGQILKNRPDHEAPRSGTPDGNLESASTHTGNTADT